MNYVFGLLFVIVALLVFIMVANNSWLNLWDRLKTREQNTSTGGDLPLPEPSQTPGQPF